MKKYFLVLILLLIAIPCFATTYYVCDTESTCGTGWVTGSDSNNGTAKATPYKTIQKCADIVNAGDTCIVGDGTYTSVTNRNGALQLLYIDRGGTFSLPVTIKSENTWGAKIYGDGSTNTDFGIMFSYVNSPGYVHLEGFDIGHVCRNGAGDGIFVNARTPTDCTDTHAHHITLYKLKVHDICRVQTNLPYGMAGIDMDPCTEPIMIDSCVFYNIGRLNYYTNPQAVPGGTKAQNEATCTNGTQVICYSLDPVVYNRGDNVTVQNCIFYPDICSGWPVQPWPKYQEISGLKIINNTFYSYCPGNSNHVKIASSSHGYGDVTIENNIFHSPRGNAIDYNSSAEAIIRNNIVYGAGLVDDNGCDQPNYTCSGDITGDPLFIDLINRNFHIMSTSPAKDTGLATNAPAYDFDGVSRPQNSVDDIGAYELVQTDPNPPTLPGNTTIGTSSLTCSSVALDWIASTDDVLMGGYKIERCTGAACSDFAQVGTNPTTQYSDGSSWSDSPLSASTIYRYRVRPYDAAGNNGSYYTISQITTPSCATPCTAWIIKKSTQTVYLTQNNCTDFNEANSKTVGNLTIWGKYTNAGIAFCASATDTELNYIYNLRDEVVFKDDGFSLLFDTEHDAGATADNDDYWFTVNIGNVQRDYRGGTGSTWDANWTSTAIATGTINTNSDTDTGFIIKMLIPWTNWGISAPAGNSTWGFELIRNETSLLLQGAQTYYCDSIGDKTPNGYADMTFEANSFSTIGGSAGTGTLGTGGGTGALGP